MTPKKKEKKANKEEKKREKEKGKRFIHIPPLAIAFPGPVKGVGRGVKGLIEKRRRKKKVVIDGKVEEVIVEEEEEDPEPAPPPLPSHLPTELLLHILTFLVPSFHSFVPNDPSSFHHAVSPLNPLSGSALEEHNEFVHTFTCLRLVCRSWCEMATPDLFKVVLYVDMGNRRLGALARCKEVAGKVRAMVIGHAAVLGLLNDVDIVDPIHRTSDEGGEGREEEEGVKDIVPSFGRMLSSFDNLQFLQWDQSSILQMLVSLHHDVSLSALPSLTSIAISNERRSPDIMRNDNLQHIRALDWNLISRCIRGIKGLKELKVGDKIMSPATILLPRVSGVDSHFHGLYIFPDSLQSLTLGHSIVTSSNNFPNLLSLIGHQLTSLIIRESTVFPDRLFTGLTYCDRLKKLTHVVSKYSPQTARRYMDGIVHILPPSLEDLDFVSVFASAEWAEELERSPISTSLRRLTLRNVLSAVEPPENANQNTNGAFEPALVWSSLVSALQIPTPPPPNGYLNGTMKQEGSRSSSSSSSSFPSSALPTSQQPTMTRTTPLLTALKELTILQTRRFGDWDHEEMPERWIGKVRGVCEKRGIRLSMEQEDEMLSLPLMTE
ncbi:hypothetical protein BT69DRAFT_1324556 [Atractiella rhizophila]|nr:hypothetical protein BT69DRAFT_1324556 [Atractiella rhizophila]